MFRFIWLFPIAALFAGCGRADTAGHATQTMGVRDIRIVATDYRFTPDIIEASPGETLRITIVNKGSHDHSFVVGGGEDYRAQLQEILKPNEDGTLIIKMPDNGAELQFQCPVARHDSRGMSGRIVAKRPADGVNSAASAR